MFEIVDQENVKVYLHMYYGDVQQNPLAQHPVSQIIFPSLAGSRLRFFIAV